ncbi:hypothetical protein KBB08_02695 [Candidatus Gracilibacteria bacterium]|nr:hypothetical protein [Candidatus Gracilibacteria bacterium]
MADIENPIALERSQDTIGQSKPQEAGAFPPGVVEKAKEYGVQPGQWQQYGQQIQQEYDRIMKLIMKEYKLLDQAEQMEIIKAIESGDDSALDDVMLHVDARLTDQDRALPHVLNNIKKVAAKNILELASQGKLFAHQEPAQQPNKALLDLVEVLVTLYKGLNQQEQIHIATALKKGDVFVLDSLVQQLPMLGLKLEMIDTKELKEVAAKRILGE